MIEAEIYTADWHARHAWTHDPARRCLLEQFRLFGKPTSYLDVGCGPGQLVQVAIAEGVVLTAGLDIAATMRSTMRVDLREHFDLKITFDQVTCWEVAEHLPPARAASFAIDLARHVGRWLVFTAAAPGQGGEGHLNEQPATYWRAALEAAGLAYRPVESAELAKRWKPIADPCWWYPQNVQVFGSRP